MPPERVISRLSRLSQRESARRIRSIWPGIRLQPEQAAGEADRIQHRLEGVGGQFLRHEPDGPARGAVVAGDVVAVDQHRAGTRRDDAADDVDQRRLAGPVRAEQREDLATLDGEVDVTQGGETRRVGLRQLRDGEDRHQGLGSAVESAAAAGVAVRTAGVGRVGRRSGPIACRARGAHRSRVRERTAERLWMSPASPKRSTIARHAWRRSGSSIRENAASSAAHSEALGPEAPAPRPRDPGTPRRECSAPRRSVRAAAPARPRRWSGSDPPTSVMMPSTPILRPGAGGASGMAGFAARCERIKRDHSQILAGATYRYVFDPGHTELAPVV